MLVMHLQIFLRDEAAHRMRDDDRRRIELIRNLLHVRDIVRDRIPAQAFATFAASVSAQAESSTVISVGGEEGQEVLIPAPGSMPFAMHKEQRRPFGFAVGLSVDYFKFHRFDWGIGNGFLVVAG